MQYTLNLPANTPISQGTSGSFFLLMDTGAATSVDIAFRVHSQVAEHVTTAKRGLKAKLSNGQNFTRLDFLSTVACVVTFIVSDGVVDISQLDGANVSVVNNGTPIQVSNDRGTPGAPIYISGTIPGSGPATAITDDTPVAIAATATSVLAASATRVRIVFFNAGSSPVALGSSAITWAKGAVFINPGDTWIEDRAANLAWYAICNTGASSSLAVQEIAA